MFKQFHLIMMFLSMWYTTQIILIILLPLWRLIITNVLEHGIMPILFMKQDAGLIVFIIKMTENIKHQREVLGAQQCI